MTVQAVLDAIPSNAALLDDSGTILYVNTGWRNFAKDNGFGGSASEVGSNYLKTYRSTTGSGTDMARLVAHGIERVAKGEEPHFSSEYPSNSPTGKRSFLVHVARLELRDGTTRLIVVHEDVGPIKLAENTLRETEERFRPLLETMNVVPWEADAVTWQFTYVGPQAERLFGYPIARWYEKEFWAENLFAADRERAFEFCLQHSQTDDQYEFDYRMHRADGRIAWIHDVVSVVRDRGRPILLRGFLIDMTARNEADEALRESQERFALAVQGSNTGIWDRDLKTNRTYLSPRWKSMLGYEEYEITDCFEEWENRIHPEDRERVRALVKDYLDGRVPEYEVQHRLRHKDGTYRWILSRGVSVRDATGKPMRIAGSHVDITKLKVTQKALEANAHALREQERLFIHLAETIDQVFWFAELDPERVIYVSPAFQQIWGIPVETLYRDPRVWMHTIHPDDRERVSRAFDAYIRGHAPAYRIEYRIQRQDGTLRWIQDNGTRRLDNSGRVRWVSGIAKDITESKRAEEALRESEGRFRLMADAAPILMWMSGPDKRSVYFNKGWLEFTGRQMEQELRDDWSENIHPEDVQGCTETYSQAFDARERFEMEYRLRRHDSEYRWMWDIGVPRFGEAGQFAGYIGTCVDITDRKRAEIALRELSGRLIHAQEEERGRIARELHDDVSQRLALLGIELEQLGQQSAPSAAQLSARTHGLWKTVRDISADIHNLSHDLHPSKLDHLGLATAIRSFCNDRRVRGDLRIEFACRDVPDSLPKDIALCLYRVLQEAIQNAVKHSRTRDAKVAIYGSSTQITLRVSDAGIGFNPDADSMKTGLGLTSMRERVRLVGGELSIQSQPSKGTLIEVRVPLASAS